MFEIKKFLNKMILVKEEIKSNIIDNFFFFKEKYEFNKLYSKTKKIAPSIEQKILFWSLGGEHFLIETDATFAAALKLRGQSVHMILCDGKISACVQRENFKGDVPENWKQKCGICKKKSEKFAQYFGLEYSFVGDYLNKEILSELRSESENINWEKLDNFKYNGIELGNTIKSSVQRCLKGSNYINPKLLKEYVFSGLAVLVSSEKIMMEYKPDKIFMTHGIYVDWGPALKNAFKFGVEIVKWHNAYLSGNFYLKFIKNLRKVGANDIEDSTWDVMKKVELKNREKDILKKYLKKRYMTPSYKDKNNFKKYTSDVDSVKKMVGLDNHKKIWTVFSHLNYDAVSDYYPMLYENFNEWILDTIETIKPIKNVNWLIKIHPAESWLNPENGIRALISKYYPVLPDHIRIIDADININPYNFFEIIDGAITVFGTSGMELAYLGKPVILAGSVNYFNNGFTYDPKTIEEYRAFLKKVEEIPPLNSTQKSLAEKYAFIYWIRRQIPFAPVYSKYLKFWKYEHCKRNLLLPGKDPYVEFLMDRILDGKEFIMSDKMLDLDKLEL